MKIKYGRENLIFYIFYFIVILCIFYTISYFFFLKKFERIEDIQNKNNISSLLSNINIKLEHIKSITNDYSKWDATYEFINKRNIEYINENFRVGTDTLSDLDIDFMIFENSKEEIFYSNYRNLFLKINKNEFEKTTSNKFKNTENINTIFKYKSKHIILSKSKILRSDYTGKFSGHLYSGKIITNNYFKNNIMNFNKIKISEEHLKESDFILKYNDLMNAKVKVFNINDILINKINIYNNNDFILSITTNNLRSLVNEGKETIFFFNIIISIFLFITLFILYKNQMFLINHAKILELKVRKRTKKLHIMAHVDTLTNISNRRDYFQRSEKVLKKSILDNTNFSILLIDIDHFKKINDTYGHANGDKVLKEFCKIVNSILEENTIFARIGGEEFCITFINKTVNESKIISEEIRNRCQNNIILIDNNKIQFTISLGLSFRNNFSSIDEILQVSDELLYKAKRNGRNRLIISQ